MELLPVSRDDELDVFVSSMQIVDIIIMALHAFVHHIPNCMWYLSLPHNITMRINHVFFIVSCGFSLQYTTYNTTLGMNASMQEWVDCHPEPTGDCAHHDNRMIPLVKWFPHFPGSYLMYLLWEKRT